MGESVLWYMCRKGPQGLFMFAHESARAKMGLSVSLFATLTVAREASRFSGIGRIALGVVA